MPKRDTLKNAKDEIQYEDQTMTNHIGIFCDPMEKEQGPNDLTSF